MGSCNDSVTSTCYGHVAKDCLFVIPLTLLIKGLS